VTQLLEGIVIIGGPGLIVGAGIAATVGRRRALAFLTVLVAIGLFYAARHMQGGDEESRVIFLIAAFTNFAGWIVGLLIGALTTRFTRRA
jgi:small-conductance mechanosensitive channel